MPYIDRLFDENVLIGTGWTTYESLRLVLYTPVTKYRLICDISTEMNVTERHFCLDLFA